MTRPSWLVVHCLRIVTSTPRAEAIVGDILEDAARRGGQVSRVRLEFETWRHVVAEAGALATRMLRSAGFVVRDAWRSLRSTPAVTTFVIGILTLGISAATVTFSVVDSVVLRSLPYADADRLAVVQTRSTSTSRFTATSVFLYERLRDGVPAFAALAATAPGLIELPPATRPEPVISARVTANLFEVLGIQPVIGKVFDATHESAGNDNVVLISYNLWQRRFGADPGIVGRPLTMAKGSLTILGVMPRGFAYPITHDVRPELWTPLVAPADERSGQQLSSYLNVVGRLAPGVSLQDATTQAATALSTIEIPPGPSVLTTKFVEARLLSDVLFAEVRGWMLLALAAVILVLVVACANVANMLLTRAARRSREFSIRASIGASRRHLVTSMLVESVMLSMIAAGLSLAIASFGVDVARASLPTGIARASTIALDWRVFVAAVSAALVTGLLFGAVPAWLVSRQGLVISLKQSSTQSTAGSPAWRSAFLVAQVALVGLLLVTTTLFVSSFVRVSSRDLGFNRQNLLTVSKPGLHGSAVDVMRQIETIPGVIAVGAHAYGSAPLAIAGGFGGGGSATQMWLPGAAEDQRQDVRFMRTAPGYFKAAGVSILEGRDFEAEDAGRPDRVVMDVLTARRMFGDRSPVGATVQYSGVQTAVVIGLVATVSDRGPEMEANAMVYMPAKPAASQHLWLVRTAGDPTPIIPAIQSTLDHMAAPGESPAEARPLQDAFRFITAERRFAAGMMSIFGAIALVIGAAGIYGVMMATVTQRTREFGVRLALGAPRKTIVSGVIRQATRSLVIGLAIGLPCGFAVSLTMSSMFFEARPSDLSTYVIVALITLTFGVLAAFWPAQRASRVDPQVTLRAE